MTSQKFTRLASVSLVGALLSTPASAERVLEEVIVTATKRAQSVNDIPVAVSAYGADQLEQSGIRDVSEVTSVSPSLDYGSTESSASGNLSMRGIGTLGTDPGLESSVGVFIDGVYRNRSGVAIDELGQVERIEVLRGPQGTLFGRNTSAGLIHVITKGPNLEEPEGYVGLTAGNYDLKRFEGGISGPIKEGVLAGRLDTVITQRDGYLEDINSDETYNDRDRYMLRGQLAFEPSDRLATRFIVDYSKREEKCCGAPTSQQATGPQNVNNLTLNNSNDRALDSNDDPYDHNIAVTSGREIADEAEQWGVSAEVNYDFDAFQLVSITAYREWETDIIGDTIDFSGADLFYWDEDAPQNRQFETFSQEFRAQGNWEHGRWLVGAIYSDETLSTEYTARYGADLNNYAIGFFGQPTYAFLTQNNNFIAGDGVNDEGEQVSKSMAIFTQEDFDLSDQLMLTVGLRYTREEKDIELTTRSNFSANGNPCLGVATNPSAPAAARTIICGISALSQPLLADGTYTADKDDSELTGTVKLAYTLENGTLLFASAATGFKAGGFNQTRLSVNPLAPTGDNLGFEPETVTTYELGFKTFLLNQTMSLNGTVFQSTFEDYQLGQFTGVTLETVSVDEVESNGAELEATWLATDELTVNAGAVYTDNRYPDDSNIDQRAPTSDGNKRAGERLGALWSATAGVTWNQSISETLGASFHIDARYRDDSFSNSSLDQDFAQDSFVLVNGRIGVGDLAKNWSVELWGRNLTDEEYTQVELDPPPIQGTGGNGRIGAFVGEPRTYGITARKNF
ncbi:outer membrane receptor protein involved in Fe transport [Litorivivens lipolytica]|uniref:Outer membrane receptor protein involved in Fe transport n=1 Tax=Litorivivens lipolytica TaxID=1524264 RepID=A0A7W4Z750_9GAMM|nr:TonB-dependent receptor [Litorivivens lipolytica]MBB3047675.1 outer membrane receptor protein involved in Fe transport [Litorivivens lipolytica]